MELIEIMAEGTMKAMILHTSDRDIKVTDQMLAKVRQTMKDEWDEMMNTTLKAIDGRMGESTYKHILNVYCNSWAVKAIS